MTLEALEQIAQDLRRDFPPCDCLVRIFAPVGWAQRAAEAAPELAKHPAVDVASALYGVPIVEHQYMPQDSPPWGKFADGSIRPLGETRSSEMDVEAAEEGGAA